MLQQAPSSKSSGTRSVGGEMDDRDDERDRFKEQV